jgi:hypothetical protein
MIHERSRYRFLLIYNVSRGNFAGIGSENFLPRLNLRRGQLWLNIKGLSLNSASWGFFNFPVSFGYFCAIRACPAKYSLSLMHSQIVQDAAYFNGVYPYPIWKKLKSYKTENYKCRILDS